VRVAMSYAVSLERGKGGPNCGPPSQSSS
jgi:hypothetical protein